MTAGRDAAGAADVDGASVVDATDAAGRHAAPSSAPSTWIVRFAPLVPKAGRVLDLACGSGRHARLFARNGHAVTAVDRDAAVVAPLANVAEVVVADLEGGPWPLDGRSFDAIVVANYLWRPLFPALRDALAPGGVLLYETFAVGQETIGRPARREFLLEPGELLRAFASLRIVAYEDGFASDRRFVQRLAAVREAPAHAPARYPLDASSAEGRSLESAAARDLP